MASESQIAIRLADTMAKWLMVGGQPKGTMEQAIDAELQEVRNVLESLSVPYSADGSNRHWCESPSQCNEFCQRARTLWARLEVK